MARIRHIKPDFFLDEELAALGPYAQVLFAGLWCQADRRGRLEDRPKRIKASALPYSTDVDVDELLTKLSERGFIQRYEVDGFRYVQVTKFEKHQYCNAREQDSIIPPPTCTVHVPYMCDTSNGEPVPPCNSRVSHKEGKGSKYIADPVGFVEFWNEYPRKDDKKGALAYWVQLSPDEDLRTTIIAHVKASRQSSQWTREHGKYIPYAVRYLRKELWLGVDESMFGGNGHDPDAVDLAAYKDVTDVADLYR